MTNNAKKDSEDATKVGKMSIMTTSNGKTLKRKQEDDILKIDADEVSLIGNEKKKVALNDKSEITITPIPKEIKEPEAPTA